MTRLSKFFLAIAILLGLAVFLVFSRSGKGVANDEIRFQLQWFDQAQFAGFYVAKNKGYYWDEGLNVNINPGGYATRPVDLVESRQAEIALAPADVALRGIANNKPISMLGVVFDRSMVCFMSKKENELRTPIDLKGKVVGVYSGFDTDNVLTLMLKKFDVQRDSVDIRDAGQLVAFEKGDFDAWPSYRFNEPVLMKRKNIPVDCMKPEDFGISYYSDSIIVSDEFLAESPDKVAAFIRASAKGWQYAIDHPDEVVKIMYETDGIDLTGSAIDRNHQLGMASEVLDYVGRPEGTPLFSIDRAKMESMTDSLVGIGVIPAAGKSVISEKVKYNYLSEISE